MKTAMSKESETPKKKEATCKKVGGRTPAAIEKMQKKKENREFIATIFRNQVGFTNHFPSQEWLDQSLGCHLFCDQLSFSQYSLLLLVCPVFLVLLKSEVLNPALLLC